MTSYQFPARSVVATSRKTRPPTKSNSPLTSCNSSTTCFRRARRSATATPTCHPWDAEARLALLPVPNSLAPVCAASAPDRLALLAYTGNADGGIQVWILGADEVPVG